MYLCTTIPYLCTTEKPKKIFAQLQTIRCSDKVGWDVGGSTQIVVVRRQTTQSDADHQTFLRMVVRDVENGLSSDVPSSVQRKNRNSFSRRTKNH